MPVLSKLVVRLIKKIGSGSGKPQLCTAVIAAAGSSIRMGGEDKLFVCLNGAPALVHTIAAFQKCSFIHEIIVVTRQDKLEYVSGLCSLYGATKVSKVVTGGQSRLESVLSGLLAVSENSALVAVHDGARPCVTENVIKDAVTAAGSYYAVAPAVMVSSTMKRASNGNVIETVDRENLFEIQTPQVFDKDLIKAALTNAQNRSLEITDDCMAVELLGFPVHLSDGSKNNIKLTTGEDLAVAEAILLSNRSGPCVSGLDMTLTG